MMASISTEYYQILLSQGVCSAIGAAAIFQGGTEVVILLETCKSANTLQIRSPGLHWWLVQQKTRRSLWYCRYWR